MMILPFRSVAVSGGELSHPVTPSKEGSLPSTGSRAEDVCSPAGAGQRAVMTDPFRSLSSAWCPRRAGKSGMKHPDPAGSGDAQTSGYRPASAVTGTLHAGRRRTAPPPARRGVVAAVERGPAARRAEWLGIEPPGRPPCEGTHARSNTGHLAK